MAGGSGDDLLGDLRGIATEDARDNLPPDTPEVAGPVVAPGVQVDAEVASAIRDAAIAYVRQETAIDEITVEIEAVADDWARVRAIPAGSTTDPATLYLRKDGTAWRGVAIGTGFIPPDLDEMGIPRSVRPQG